jgi:hypothetical protein
MVYRDFDLLVERAGTDCRARVLGSPGGTAALDFRLPFTNLELENFLLRVGRSRRVVRRAESSELQAAKTFGAALFTGLFSGEVESCFHRSVDAARREGAGLRIRLRLRDASLADLPWEYLYNPAVNRFLALSIQTPLVRYMDLADPILPVAVTPPIRALVMISSPADYPELDVEAEWRRLNESLQDLVGSAHLEIDRLDEATLPALQRQLRKAEYHIFHFIGHGEFDQHAQEGVLILKDDDNRGHRVGSQYLGMLLHDHPSLRVAILNACEGARSSAQDPFAGSAQTLVQQGIPAVIAMQFEIADEVASTFAHEFYGALSDGYPIDAATTEARKAIFAAGHEVAWWTPVLYLRAPDGRIFDVERRSRARKGKTGDEPRPASLLVRDAGVALAHGKYAEALKHLQLAAALDPHAANLKDLLDTAEQQRAVAETRTRRRRQLRDHVSAAAQLVAKGDLAAASARLQDALSLNPDDAAALALQARIRAEPGGPPLRAAAGERAAPPHEQVAARVESQAREPRPAPGREGRRPGMDGEEDLLD